MKAIICEGKIYNFVDDGYISGNKDVVPQEIKGFDLSIDMEKVAKNETQDEGVFKYYLDSKGIVQQKDITKEPEYKKHQVEKLLAKKMRNIALDAVALGNPDLASTVASMKEA